MYNHAALGGTFDHLHKGHEYIIDFALKQAKKLSIGISTQKLYKDKELSYIIEAYSYRKQAVEKYLSSRNALERVSIFELNNIFGTTLTDKTLDSIIVTDETELNAHRINNERQKKGLSDLKILKCPFFRGPNKHIITSTDIRAGAINRVGFPYFSLFPSEILYMDENLRETLQKPLTRPILEENEDKTAEAVIKKLDINTVLTIGIGDIVNKTLISAGFTPDLQIIDFKTRRKNIINESINGSSEQYKNEPGTLYRDATTQIHRKIQAFLHDKIKKTLVIDGEEDLLALPAILLAPLNSTILYGQFDQGIVMVNVSEEIKEKVAKLVKQFTS